jgi:hypothetical protein
MDEERGLKDKEEKIEDRPRSIPRGDGEEI